jgi:nicotinate-nucleotide pyrophosphorylase (carboxylating)
MLEKWAVKIGGGQNHRFGLFDMIMLKDNHIDYAGSITKAVESAKNYLKIHNKNIKIEVETRNIREVREVLSIGGVDVIMLDNMTTKDMKTAVELINGQAKTEASGGITDKTIVEIAETGVDYISVGALTHSIKSLDLSLKAVKI